jgi:hypothetical protein
MVSSCADPVAPMQRSFCLIGFLSVGGWRDVRFVNQRRMITLAMRSKPSMRSADA